MPTHTQMSGENVQGHLQYPDEAAIEILDFVKALVAHWCMLCIDYQETKNNCNCLVPYPPPPPPHGRTRKTELFSLL